MERLELERRSRRKKRRRRSRGSSSLEVKENQDDDVLRRFHPSAFCTSFSLKRKLVDGKDRLLSQSQPAGKRSSWAVTQKNAVVQLNELRPGLRYEITSRTGPLHAPVFSVGVEVNGLHFEGRGPTKKKAKLRAAELALQSFIQFPNASQAQASMESFTSTDSLDFTADSLDFTADKLDFTADNLDFTADKLDFTADKLDFEPSLLQSCDLLQCSAAKHQVFSSSYSCTRLVQLRLDLLSSATPKRRAVSASFFQPLSPVVLLGRLRPGLRYMCLTERLHGRPARSFVMVLRLEGRVFEGCGHSKRLAKAQAAAAALQDLYSISLGPERKLPGLQDSSTKNQLPQFFSDSIFHLVTEKFRELTDGRFSTSSARHKVLAGIVMTRGLDLRSASVVSLATGTKCVDCGRQEDDVGWTLSDCHAETVSRRALVRFLYSQLELLMRKPADGQESSIFVPNKSCSGVFRLWDGILFHMFVSSSPCGDARLNCPYENIGSYPSRKFRFHLRKKVNGGEGTLPVSTNQRWDGLSPGKSLVSMSCTDKMAKWSVVGLQGSLLSHLVEPVYLHSLTVGTLSHTGHLSRAMRRRLATVKHLPFPYRRRALLLGCLSSREVRPAGKPASVSLNWSCGDGGLEEVSSSTGRRTDSGTPSRLCSRSAFIRWLKLQQQVNGSLSDAEAALASCSASKMSAGRYQRAMQRFSSALQAGGLGTWLRKPPALHNFSM
ncbi:double-stranded RNA-specific editase B2-like [Acanthochromis polyacanthus]|uniref:double-stranded RNA-specific editase B2-like n=1 Tax=Acanthochromis polyacanthus TaxID=80966 RepID=UPI002233F84F|nr:double-stranded RNA-specific editase B2-like [Acanthochromis polyacanthus]